MLLIQVYTEVRGLLEDLHAEDPQAGVGGDLPGVFLGVVVHDGPEDHQLDTAALQQGHLVLLAQLGEAELSSYQDQDPLNVSKPVYLLRHLDNPFDCQLRQIDDAVLKHQINT